MKRTILVIHGPNLNLVGTRSIHIYGKDTLDDINRAIIEKASEYGILVDCFQSNSEGTIIDKIHSARGQADGIIINAGAFAHYSYALMDAIAAVNLPCVDVHLSNIYAREEFRHTSLPACVSIGHICGFGRLSYLMAVDALAAHFNGVGK